MSEEWMGWREGMKCELARPYIPPGWRADQFSVIPNLPTRGVVYTVRTVEMCAYTNELAIRLVEIVNEPRWYLEGWTEPRFFARAFRPIVGTERGMEILERIRIKASEPVRKNADATG